MSTNAAPDKARLFFTSRQTSLHASQLYRRLRYKVEYLSDRIRNGIGKGVAGLTPRFQRRVASGIRRSRRGSLGPLTNGPIPSDENVEESFNAPGADVWHIVSNGKRAGGAVVTSDKKTRKSSLNLFYKSFQAQQRTRVRGVVSYRETLSRYARMGDDHSLLREKEH